MMHLHRRFYQLLICSALGVFSTANAKTDYYFNRVATFGVCTHIDQTCNNDTETAAEIVYVDKLGKTLVYTNSLNKELGIVDIQDLKNPKPVRTIKLNGEPTSVVIKDRMALVVVKTSKDEECINTKGQLQVYHLDSFSNMGAFELGGQPDSIALSPDGRFAAIAIENERNEEFDDGNLPQLPAGYLAVFNLDSHNPQNWTMDKIELTGLSGVFTEDPELEYVSINNNNIAAITLQENNAIVLVDLANKTIINHFSAGHVDLTKIDASEKKPLYINLSDSLNQIPREPDGVVWIDDQYFATANEGDWKGGSRGFSVFNTKGEVVWDSGNELEHLAVRFGHYPKKRSENKGNEPENIAYGEFDGEKLLFVNSERSSLVFVYDVSNPTKPVFKQILPTGVAPEGAYVINSRNALVVAAEKDSREDQIRSSITIYERTRQPSKYPTITSADKDGLPLAWSALSGLAADINNKDILYAVEDSFYGKNRFFTLDISKKPAIINDAIHIKDTKNILSKSFKGADSLVNADSTVNIDAEGIVMDDNGDIWIASEGSGSSGDEKRPVKYPNFILRINKSGEILQVITLPSELNAQQSRFGLEGIAAQNNKLYVAWQRAWGTESNPRIGIYDLMTNAWEFVFYPLDKVESQDKGWVGISEIVAKDDGVFWVLERDNKAGFDATIKRIYEINLNNYGENQIVKKTLVRDLIPDLKAPNGFVLEKVEGMAITKDNRVFIVTDNDGVDNSNGETQLIEIQ